MSVKNKIFISDNLVDNIMNVILEELNLVNYNYSIDMFNNFSFGISPNRNDEIYNLNKEAIDSGMFNVSDFLTKNDLKHHQICIPKGCRIDISLIPNNQQEFIKDLLNKSEYLTNIEILVYILLHEIGHAHHLFEICKGDLREFYNEDLRFASVLFDDNRTTFEKFASKPTEKIADAFAIKHFNKINTIIKETYLV